MADYENCPVCHKELPADLEANFCPFCGVRFDPNAGEPLETIHPTVSTEPEQQEKVPEQEGIAWESQTELGLLSRLTRTWSESLFNTVHFFRNMKITPGIGMAFLYGLLFKIIGTAFSIYWQKDAMSNLENDTQDWPAPFQEAFKMIMDNPILSSPETQLLLAPILGVFTLFLTTIIFHIAMLITGAAKKGFEATFRVVAYSEGTAIFQAIPFIGGWITLVLWLVLLVIGSREVHRSSTGQVLAGIALPLFLCLCLVAISVFTLTSTLF